VQVTGSTEKIKKERSLFCFLNPQHFLRDVFTGAADAPNSKKDVVVEKISCQDLSKHEAYKQQGEIQNGLLLLKLNI